MGVLGVAGAVVAVLYFFPVLTASAERAEVPAAPPPAPSSSSPAVAPGVAAAACSSALKCVPYSAPDPMHVDALEVLPAALQLAQSIERGAFFCEMSLVSAVDGAIAVGADARSQGPSVSTLRFGTGKGTRAIDVAVVPGHLFATESTCARAAPIPACQPRAAARAAVASGAPRGVPVLMHYHQDELSGVPLWDYVLQGRPEYSRRIDGRTCAVKYRPR